MTVMHVAAGTDTGKVREANEDSFYVGETVYAVADGMGGHLAGEVASHMALEPIQELDGKVFPDPAAATEALREAIVSANRAVSGKAADDPKFRGMGTTLTAVLLENRRLHLGHVGDSRAYLLRGNDFQQLTDDHTLVQHLIDEGQITKEEAASHPQRSIITRAIGVAPTVEVDTMTLDLDEGDVILLCSDGLTGVIDDEQIVDCINNDNDDETTVRGLIALANEAGGPDNITVLLLRYGEPSVATAASDHDTGELAAAEGGQGPEGERRVIVRTDDGTESRDWAQRLGRFGQLGLERDRTFDDDAPSGPARWQRWGAILLGLVLIAALIIGGGQWLLSRSYFVGLEGDEVVIYQGVPAELGPIDLASIHERTGLTTDDLPEFVVQSLRDDGVQATGLGDARRIVEGYEEMASEEAGDGETGPTEQPTSDDGGS
ncbi:MAG: Stp1/IreP family PP2C-type Ser/Thr phosphatase [Nitriliruptorales bacterium]|nr:Stp1/IreP family PP2C-type Ser/Thr phosphatase [Nitriliruptorales bacterium]